jgi:hypothetical protein
MESLAKSFGQTHFGDVDLGDVRRNRRLPELVDRMVEKLGGTLPSMLPRAADTEAFYRLCDAEEVTHAAVHAPHRALMLKKLQTTRKFLLVLHDTTELDYTTRSSLTDLGQIGNGGRRGLLAHNSLVVDVDQGHALGLAQQILHRRAETPKKESVAELRARESRESLLWLRGTEGLPQRREVVDVCDRGADTFEFLEHECASQRTFVIRSARNRIVSVGHEGRLGKRRSLYAYLRSLPAVGKSETTVRISQELLEQRRQAREQDPSQRIDTIRVAKLSVSFAAVRIHAPHVRRGNHGTEPRAAWVVRVWEPDPPHGCEALEWFLITNFPVASAAHAKIIIQWYEARWIIEEYHKGLKTGCGIEKLQFRDKQRLEPAIAILSVAALNLLQLRDAARQPNAKTRRADELVEPDKILVLSLWKHGVPNPNMTVLEYYTTLAELGGYRRRKNCPPGWQVLWRGHIALHHLVEGFQYGRNLNKKTTRRRDKKCAKS